MAAKTTTHLHLVCGSEEYLVKENARRLVQSLTPKDGGEFGVEIIDGTANNADEVGKAVVRVLEAINTLGFFSSEKLVWLKDVNFLSTEKLWQSAALTEAIAPLAELVKGGLPAGVTLVISAGEIDKRRALYKACEKLGEVTVFDAIDPSRDRDWEFKVTDFITAHAKALGKRVDHEGVAQLVELNGANLRQIETELEKISAYAGARDTITADDVRAVGSAGRESLAWDLSDALGQRDLSKALRVLDRLLFQGEQAMGLLFALAGRVRQLLILRELMDRKLLRAGDYGMVKSQLDRLPANVREELPADKKLNPLMQHPFVVFKTLPQATKYTRPQLIRAMQWLLEANQQFVSSALPERWALEELLARIITAK